MLEPSLAAEGGTSGQGHPSLHSNRTHSDKMSGPAAAVVDMDTLQMQVTSQADLTSLSGDMTAGGGKRGPQSGSGATAAADYDSQFDTLDEPVWHTVRRDLCAIGAKLTHVIYPSRSDELLRNWDLWGPLFLCVFVSLVLMQSGEEQAEHRGPHFADVFILTFFGACVVTLNIKLLGGRISFFQALCVLGYCLLPPACAAALCKIVVLLAPRQSMTAFIIRVVASLLAFAWATFASTAFLSKSQPARRKALAIYPIFLFYLVISWMIASHSGVQ